MALTQLDRIRDKKINGEIFDMSQLPHYEHSIINGNIDAKIWVGLKGSESMVFMGNIDYK